MLTTLLRRPDKKKQPFGLAGWSGDFNKGVFLVLIGERVRLDDYFLI